MKKLIILILALLILVPGISFAEIQWKSGVGYSLADSKVNFLSTIELARWRGLTLEGGYAGDSEKTQDKMIAVLSYSIMEAGQYIDVPVLDLLECNIGAYAGIGRIFGSDEFDYGLSATILNIKF